jgi:hypothetical protein
LTVFSLPPTKALPSRRAFGPFGSQALEGIDDERQRLQIERDFLDGFCRGQFVDGRHGENRLALVDRLVCERNFRRQ